MFEDFDLIVSSFLTQYGVRIYSADFKQMKWKEFSALLSGLSGDTPLGNIVQIRAENDKDRLKNFTRDQHAIRNQWRGRHAKQTSPENMAQVLEMFKNTFIGLAGGVQNYKSEM